MVNRHPNISGLKPFKKDGHIDSAELERERKIQRKGAEASNKIQKQQKQMKELVNILLKSKCSKKEEEVIKNLFPDFNEEITRDVLLLTRQFKKALDGDNKSFEIIRDTAGQKPIEKTQIETIEPPKIIIETSKNGEIK